MSDLGGERLLAQITAVGVARDDRIESPDHPAALDVVHLYGVAIGESVIPIRGSALAGPDVELDPGGGRSFLAHMREVMDEQDPHAADPTAQRHLDELFPSPSLPVKRTRMPIAAIQPALRAGHISTAFERFLAKANARLDSRRADELGRALEQALDEDDADEAPSALEGLAVDSLSEAERLTAVTGGTMRRFDFEQQQLAGSLGVHEVASRRHRPIKRIEQLRAKGGLLALKDEEDEWRYPRWQFASITSGRLVPGLRRVLEELQPLPPLSRVAWLRQPKQSLEGRSPLEALREGERRRVKMLARAVRGASG